MINFKQAKEFSKFTTALTGYIAIAGAIEAATPDLVRRRKKLARIVAFTSEVALRILNITVTVNGKIPTGNFLIVSNHMSYIDVTCISSVLRANYVTSVEILETPVLGYLTRLGGSLYVERRNKTNLQNEIKDVVEALKAGMNVCVFPEATSTDGSEVIRFRRPLFRAAEFAQKPILPITVNYNKIDGEKVDIKNRDELCWYGDMEFLSHLLKMMKRKRIEISLEIHEPISVATEEESIAAADRAHDIIAASFRPLGASAPPPNSTVQ